MTIQDAISNYLRHSGCKQQYFTTALIDCDGVLFDTMKNHTRAWVKLMKKNGIKCSRDEFYLYEGMTGVEIVKKKFLEGAGKVITDDEARAIYGVKGRYFLELGETHKIAGIDQVMEVLKDYGIERIVVTGSQQPSVLDRIDREFAGMVSEKRITGNDVRHGKPSPEPYMKGIEKAGAKANQCIVIENAPLGVQSGHAAGCFTIAVMTGPISEKDLYKAGADLVLPNMIALAEALPQILNPGD
ncbi:MAG: HAD hydrolase-like protein [Muribaculaceae bacterium]|nr:HAD hydrolase-like protein [Muribaculaceae bacterium]